ncbi:SIN3-HDAC complex associated factor, like isoform X2 [Latimeria chalumnae]|uniref:SIN3-HDAC complex associated factor, like isoform X2 n=1 Tax=Latimeria chalumnae TaxID=7897 RepID=UPI0003C177E7|nr:PREDICTED: protein FAM60A-like isoform X3 [Latimeria chalumnae]|eukprot:XP_005989737.1 PREDICTED: protein FAM60A-like isoform X3 [Latimeria chalumnae]
MFGFHKSKIYRSLEGCCICKTKSSSSRFTDSRRYEESFRLCFGLLEQRTGDICNACVLLVKRWKKLPVGSKKNWSHVVDARGPGFKVTKLKKIKSISDKRRKIKPKILQKLRRQKPTEDVKNFWHNVPLRKDSRNGTQDDNTRKGKEDTRQRLTGCASNTITMKRKNNRGFSWAFSIGRALASEISFSWDSSFLFCLLRKKK